MFDFQNKSLPEIAADNLLKYIIDNKFEIGDKIPNEFELAKHFGVGRSTIREAVRLLVSRNILVVKRGSGTFIADRTGISDDPLGLSFVENKYVLAKDLVDLRLILEPAIAAMAAMRATDEEIETIEKQCKKVEKLYMDSRNHIYEDVRFHEMIARCSGNQVMEKLIPIIDTSVAVFCNVTDRALKNETIMTHRMIVKAIKNHDPESARYAMTMHLIYNRKKIYEILEENKVDK